MITLNGILIWVLVASPYGLATSEWSICQNALINNEEVECPEDSVYIQTEGRCVDIRQFTCPKSSLKTVEYLADPYLCNVHHMCYQGVEVSRVCCSPGQMFSPELQDCTDGPIGQMKNCESDPCALKQLDNVCSFSFEPRTGAVPYPTEECPAVALFWSASLFHYSLEPERYLPYDYSAWEGKAATANCTNHKDGDAYCLSCTSAVLCLDLGGEALTSFTAACDAPGTACSAGECLKVVPGNSCACTSSSGLSFQPDPYTDTSYITCIEGTAYYTNCTDGQVFDGISKCVTPVTTTTVATTTPAPCTTADIGLNGINCYQYRFCTADGAPPVIKSCDPGQFFDPNTNHCIEQVPPFKCEKTGSFADPYDCRRYYICSGTTLFSSVCCKATDHYDATLKACTSGSCTSNFECMTGYTTTSASTTTTSAFTTTISAVTTTTSAVTTTTSASITTTSLSATTTSSGSASIITSGSTSTPTQSIITTTSGSITTTSEPGSITTTRRSSTTIGPKTCDGTNDGQYFVDPQDPHGYYFCRNGKLVHGTCIGIQEFNCVDLSCTNPENIPAECMQKNLKILF